MSSGWRELEGTPRTPVVNARRVRDRRARCPGRLRCPTEEGMPPILINFRGLVAFDDICVRCAGCLYNYRSLILKLKLYYNSFC